MNPQEIVEISNANNRFESIVGQNKSFIEWVISRAEPQNVPSKVSVDQGTFSVAGFGFIAKAVPRAIRLTTGAFAMEFVFLVNSENEEIEVSRFYLTDDGELVEDANNSNSTLAGYKNTHIATIICINVLQGIIKSKLFAARSVAKP
jgi:hypothetical protein